MGRSGNTLDPRGRLCVHRGCLITGSCARHDKPTGQDDPYMHRDGLCLLSNALVQLQAHYRRRGEAASEKCLSAATFVRWRARVTVDPAITAHANLAVPPAIPGEMDSYNQQMPNRQSPQASRPGSFVGNSRSARCLESRQRPRATDDRRTWLEL